MSSIGAVIDYYESGMEAMQKKRYSWAARYFLVCSYHYEYGELPFFMSRVKEYGEDAMSKYDDCLEKLSKEERQVLEKILRQCKHGNWRNRASLINDTVAEEQTKEAIEEAEKELASFSQQDSSENMEKIKKKIQDLQDWLKWIQNKRKETGQ